MAKPYLIKPLKGRRPPNEDDLNILKVEYLSNHLLDYTQIFYLTLDEQNIIYKSKPQWKTASNGRRPQNSKKWNVSANTYWTILLF